MNFTQDRSQQMTEKDTNILLDEEVFPPHVGVQNCLKCFGIITCNLEKRVSILFIPTDAHKQSDSTSWST